MSKRLLVRFPEPIFTRVTTPTKQWLDDRALQDGTSVAAFARRILEREAQRELQEEKGQDEQR